MSDSVHTVEAVESESGRGSLPAPSKVTASALQTAADAVRKLEQVSHWRDRLPAAGVSAHDITVAWRFGRSLGGYEPLTEEVAAVIGDRFRELVLEALDRIERRAEEAVITALDGAARVHAQTGATPGSDQSLPSPTPNQKEKSRG